MGTSCVPMGAEPTSPALTDDAAIGGRLRLRQPARGHRFGHDAILLAASTPAHGGDVAIDLGAGVGAAGLALAQRVGGLTLHLVEIDPALARLAADNATRNGLAARVSAHVLDVAAPPADFAAAGLALQNADRVLMNPPFHDSARTQPSPDTQRRVAHAALPGGLAIWLGTAARLLRPGGTLSLIYHADRLDEILGLIDAGFGGVTIQPVHPKPGAAAIRVLLRAVKGSRAPLALLPGVLLPGEDGRPTAPVEAVLRDGATLPLAELP